MSAKSGRLDWDLVRERLERSSAALEQGRTDSPEDLEAVFRERAVTLARVEAAPVDLSGANMLLVFRIGAMRFGLLASDVQEVLRDSLLTPVPGAPTGVMGVMQVRGEIRPVYNLLAELREEGGPGLNGPVILAMADEIPIGIKVDEVEDIQPLDLLQPRQPGDRAAVAWITDDFVSVLDLRALWRTNA